MAKLPKTGVTYSSLYEKDCTLAEVIKNLGLKSLSRKAERQIRDRLGFALGTWEAPHPPFVIKDIVRLLNSYAKCLKALEKLGTIARAGFASEDEIVVGGELVQILASEPAIGSVKGAHAYPKDFSDRAALSRLRVGWPREICSPKKAKVESRALTGMTTLLPCYWKSVPTMGLNQPLEWTMYREQLVAALLSSPLDSSAYFLSKCAHPRQR